MMLLSTSARPLAKAVVSARPIRVAAPVLNIRHQKRQTIAVVRAADSEEFTVMTEEDIDRMVEEAEVEMNGDPRQQQREFREDRRQAGGRGGRGEGGRGEGGGRGKKEDDGFEDRIVQVRHLPAYRIDCYCFFLNNSG